MIEHRRSFAINVPNTQVWRYVSDMANWAGSMPGYKSFEIIDEQISLWTLKVGIGALVRTVQVRVVIEEWEEPDHVSFSFTLENDPVDGHGTYDATIASQDITTVDISFQVAGRGAMSPVWEAMMRPILPRMAQGFTDTLKAAIELGAEPTPADMGLGTTHD